MKHPELSEDERDTLREMGISCQLTWTTPQRSTARDDVIAFFDQVAAQSHSVLRIVSIDNAAIHNGKVTDTKRRLWVRPRKLDEKKLI